MRVNSKNARSKNHGYEPQSKRWKPIPQQAAGYYTLRCAGLFNLPIPMRFAFRIGVSRIKSILLFCFLFLLFILASCTLKTVIVSPEGTWTYPGGAVEPMSMVFHSNDKLTFVGGFKKHNPATWQYDKKTQKLQIKISNYDKSDNECGDYNEEYSCLLYNSKTDSFECKWTEKTKSLSFLGWNFLRK